MPAARYVCCANEGFISYRIGAKRQYIEFEQSENISSGRSSHIDRKKNKSKNRRISPFTLALSVCIGGWVSCIATPDHKAFVRSNANGLSPSPYYKQKESKNIRIFSLYSCSYFFFCRYVNFVDSICFRYAQARYIAATRPFDMR